MNFFRESPEMMRLHAEEATGADAVVVESHDRCTTVECYFHKPDPAYEATLTDEETLVITYEPASMKSAGDIEKQFYAMTRPDRIAIEDEGSFLRVRLVYTIGNEYW